MKERAIPDRGVMLDVVCVQNDGVCRSDPFHLWSGPPSVETFSRCRQLVNNPVEVTLKSRDLLAVEYALGNVVAILLVKSQNLGWRGVCIIHENILAEKLR